MNPNYKLLKYTIKRIDSCLKPYLVTLTLLGIVILPLEHVDPLIYFATALYGTGSFFPLGWAQLWFLPHLFVVSVFSYLCYTKLNIMSKSIVFNSSFLLIILIAGYIALDYFWNISVAGIDIVFAGLPFSIDLILISSFYFLIGSILKKYTLDFKFNWRVLIIAAIIFTFIHSYFGFTIDLNSRRYDNIIISTISSLLGIYIVLSVSKIFLSFSMLSSLLAYIGSASLFILIFHNYIQLKTINLLKLSLSGNKYIIIPIIAFTSLAIAVLVPILLYELAKRIAFLRNLFLPINFNVSIKKIAADPLQ
jgi:fucose 4-O-acetylase-like acetyltransferase